MHFLFMRHHLRPGVFWKLPPGEKLFLMASAELEIKAEKKTKKEGKRRG